MAELTYTIAFVVITVLLGFAAYTINKEAFYSYGLLILSSFLNFSITFMPTAKLHYLNCTVTFSPEITTTTIATIAVLVFGKNNYKIGAGLFLLQWIIMGILGFLAYTPSFC